MTTNPQRICLTGAAGQAGRVAASHLREHGYQVTAVDSALSADDVAAGFLKADLTDYGQATEALRGAGAVVHLANIPAPGRSTPAVTFNANMTMNFNVFHAAAALGLSRVVWASSETTLGLPFGGDREQVPDTVMNRPSRDLLAEVFPDIPLTSEIAEFGSLLATGRAKQVIGYEPRHSWRDHIAKR